MWMCGVFAPSFADPFAGRQTNAMNTPCLSSRFVAQACFDANTGRYSTCITLGRASESADGGGWKAVGLLMTKTHLIVTGNDGSIDWLTLSEEPDDYLKAGFCDSLISFRYFVLHSLHVLRTTPRVLHQGFSRENGTGRRNGTGRENISLHGMMMRSDGNVSVAKSIRDGTGSLGISRNGMGRKAGCRDGMRRDRTGDPHAVSTTK